ncbi:peroxiredoxin-like family protein [Mucilaginibacter jinjuensis]|uniref:thioredoxin-dependent peroxiredoxin n=1 Tax=Mucilaginibacter jinjuensis TaxID=1176721 RepID=A0ABY7T317_9SPHI|nr:peroxiredoxin-like family protein [Mucilaginibacter jinjuensis]WCT10585.1 peroxiredoxin-like family protein [Mucilaginibacter jinjuensis]
MKKLILIILGLILQLSVMAQSGLKAGDKAPEFTAKDNNGKIVDLKALLKTHQSVVLFFYRGQWCPYCSKHIQQLQDSLQMLTGKGAYVVGVTPETGENINKTIEKTHASFSMVQDKDYSIMKAYDVNYVMDPAMVAKYKTYGVDLDKNNGNTDHVLPVPATYIIDKSGKIKYVQFDKDYRKRPSVATILSEL